MSSTVMSGREFSLVCFSFRIEFFRGRPLGVIRGNGCGGGGRGGGGGGGGGGGAMHCLRCFKSLISDFNSVFSVTITWS